MALGHSGFPFESDFGFLVSAFAPYPSTDVALLTSSSSFPAVCSISRESICISMIPASSYFCLMAVRLNPRFYLQHIVSAM